MPRKGLTQTLHWLWVLPGELRWMDPLPLLHRRGIIAGVLLILLAFLWPSPSPSPRPPVLSSSSGKTQVNNDSTMQANIVDNAPPQQNNDNTPPPQQAPAQEKPEGRWHDYTVANGQTLAQLFRDNNLQVNDVFAMARVEGDGKPLSNLQRGQTVKVRIDAQGVVTGLTVDGDNGPALFTRQPDGSFIRVR